MKDSKYIETVLSHISQRTKRKKIEYELFDHLDEKASFWEEVGYDEDAALKKSEEAMGDADIVGEQLDSISRNNKKTILVMLTVSAILLNIAVFFKYLYDVNYYGMLSYTLTYLSSFWSGFWGFVIFSTLFIIDKFCLLTGVKRKHNFLMLTGFILSQSILFISPIHPSLFLERVDTTFILGDIFYNFNPSFYTYETKAIDTVILISVSVIITAVFITGIIISVKTKMLKNTKRDLKAKHIASIILSMIIALYTAFAAGVVAQTITLKNRIIENTKSELVQIEKSFIDTIENADELDNDILKNIAENIFQKYNVYDIDNADSKDQYICIDYYENMTDSKNTKFRIPYTQISIDNSILNPFSLTTVDYFNLYSGIIEKSNIHSLSDAPLPAALEFYYSEEESYINLSYGEQELQFEYDSDKKEYCRLKKKELTKNQKRMMSEAIEENFSPLSEPEAIKESGYKQETWYEVYDAYYKQSNDTYIINLSWCFYNYANYSGRYDDVFYEDKNVYLGSQITVKFGENGAKILEAQTVPCTDYAATTELSSWAEEYYSTSSLEKLEESDIGAYGEDDFSNETLINLQDKLREDLAKKFTSSDTEQNYLRPAKFPWNIW